MKPWIRGLVTSFTPLGNHKSISRKAFSTVSEAWTMLRPLLNKIKYKIKVNTYSHIHTYIKEFN